MVIKLDRPIDPNLVVTVRGEPLTRVRDWRGRATSVLPAAQSGSDLAAATNTAGSLMLKQLAQTRSLLESDQFAPNTWFALNSHELLLNISVDVATDAEFPVIQVAEPSGSFVIPHDLRRSFSELIINGFRLRPETVLSIQRETARQNWADDGERSAIENDAPISTGPYPFSTFLPLFTPEPAPRRFFAVIGETGNDLLIGFLPQRATQKETDQKRYYDWLETKAQVILEDRDMDFAWSLSCDVQGEILACRMPRDEISRVFRNFLKACPDEGKCPGIAAERLSLLRSLAGSSAPPTASGTNSAATPSSQVSINQRHSGYVAPTPKSALRPINTAFEPGSAGGSDQTAADDGSQNQAANDQAAKENAATDQKAKDQAAAVAAAPAKDLAARLLSDSIDLKNWSQAFVSTMQVWVEQADAEGKNVFRSPEPVPIGFLPLSDDYWRNTPFKPWEFERADANGVTLHECNYLPNFSQCSIDISLLGVRSWPNWLAKGAPMKQVPGRPDWAQLAYGYDPDPNNPQCGRFTVPTAALANDPIVFSMEFPPHPAPVVVASSSSDATCGSQTIASTQEKATPLRTTIAIPKSRLGPSFKQSEIQIRQMLEPPPSKEQQAASAHLASNASNEQTKANKQISVGKEQTETKVWQILVPVANSACGDEVELPDDLLRPRAPMKNAKPDPSYTPNLKKIDVRWMNGNVTFDACPPDPGPEPTGPNDPQSDAFKNWQKEDQAWKVAHRAWESADEAWRKADKSDRIRLYLEIPRTAINDFPARIDVVRTTGDGVKWVVATLPNLRRMLLPSRLTLDPLSATQFALRGDNAEVIDAVAMQGSSDRTIFRTAPGVDFALVTLPAQTDTTTKTDTSGSGAGSNSSIQITIDTTTNSTDHVQVTKQSSSSPAKPAAAGGKTTTPSPSDANTKAPKALAAGGYAVIPLIQVGTTPPDPADLLAAANNVTSAAANLTAANNAVAAARNGTAAQKTKAQGDLKQAQTDLTIAQAAAAQAAKPVPLYMPLAVTDGKGKPLIFTIADAKKSAAPQASTTPAAATCATPCLVAPCAVACPQVPSQAASTKSQ
jgi:hypothetical protein